MFCHPMGPDLAKPSSLLKPPNARLDPHRTKRPRALKDPDLAEPASPPKAPDVGMPNATVMESARALTIAEHLITRLSDAECCHKLCHGRHWQLRCLPRSSHELNMEPQPDNIRQSSWPPRAGLRTHAQHHPENGFQISPTGIFQGALASSPREASTCGTSWRDDMRQLSTL